MSLAVLVNDSAKDCMANAIRRNPLSKRMGVKFLSIEKMIKDVINAKQNIDINYDGIYLINRASLQDLANINHGFKIAKNNFSESAIIAEKIINKFSSVTSYPGLYALTGDLLPMNLQWKLIDSKKIELDTPQFEYIFGVENSKDSFDLKSEKFIKKDPFNIYDWKKDTKSLEEWHPFYVKIPDGIPIVCSFVEDDCVLFKLDGYESHNKTLGKFIANHLASIRQLFHLHAGEILFFVDDMKITFGAISHFHDFSGNTELFDSVIENWLNKLWKNFEQTAL